MIGHYGTGLRMRLARFKRRRVTSAGVATAMEIVGVLTLVGGIALLSVPVALIVGGALIALMAQGVKS